MNLQSVCTLPVRLKRNYVFINKIVRHFSKLQSSEILNSQKFIPPQCNSSLKFSSYPLKCWKCDHPFKSELFCSQCKAVQKLPENMNYFNIFGIKEDYDVSTDDLRKKYRELQNLLHPDRFGSKSQGEKEISENISSLINKAYDTLLHPLNRGLYMLKLRNVSISEETETADREFLMEIMEKNEEIEEASENNDKTLELLNKNRLVLTSLAREISQAFKENNINKAKKCIMRMKYYMSINERLKTSKQNLGIVE